LLSAAQPSCLAPPPRWRRWRRWLTLNSCSVLQTTSNFTAARSGSAVCGISRFSTSTSTTGTASRKLSIMSCINRTISARAYMSPSTRSMCTRIATSVSSSPTVTCLPSMVPLPCPIMQTSVPGPRERPSRSSSAERRPGRAFDCRDATESGTCRDHF
ncbi:hypothetical protein E4U39_007902, partial [Claviceps sp. Clav50 group G5]